MRDLQAPAAKSTAPPTGAAGSSCARRSSGAGTRSGPSRCRRRRTPCTNGTRPYSRMQGCATCRCTAAAHRAAAWLATGHSLISCNVNSGMRRSRRPGALRASRAGVHARRRRPHRVGDRRPAARARRRVTNVGAELSGRQPRRRGSVAPQRPASARASSGHCSTYRCRRRTVRAHRRSQAASRIPAVCSRWSTRGQDTPSDWLNSWCRQQQRLRPSSVPAPGSAARHLCGRTCPCAHTCR